MSTEHVSVSAVKLKLSPFWSEQPDAPFAQKVSIFTEEHNFLRNQNLLRHDNLTSGDITSVLDCVRSPPSENPYETLKARLV